MLRKITIENFRCFGTKQSIPIRNLNLMFGDEGKSSVMLALAWLRSILCTDQTSCELIDQLGGFEDCLFKGAREPVIRFGIELEPVGDEFFDLQLGGGTTFSWGEQTLNLDLDIRCTDEREPYIALLQISASGVQVLTVETSITESDRMESVCTCYFASLLERFSLDLPSELDIGSKSVSFRVGYLNGSSVDGSLPSAFKIDLLHSDVDDCDELESTQQAVDRELNIFYQFAIGIPQRYLAHLVEHWTTDALEIALNELVQNTSLLHSINSRLPLFRVADQLTVADGRLLVIDSGGRPRSFECTSTSFRKLVSKLQKAQSCRVLIETFDGDLNPYRQSELADVLAARLCDLATDQPMILVEIHNPYVIQRVIQRMVETVELNGSNHLPIWSSAVSFIYFESKQSGVCVRELQVDTNEGIFRGGWPNSYFDERIGVFYQAF